MRKGWIRGVNGIPTLHRYIYGRVLKQSKELEFLNAIFIRLVAIVVWLGFYFYLYMYVYTEVYMIRTRCLVAGSVL